MSKKTKLPAKVRISGAISTYARVEDGKTSKGHIIQVFTEKGALVIESSYAMDLIIEPISSRRFRVRTKVTDRKEEK